MSFGSRLITALLALPISLAFLASGLGHSEWRDDGALGHGGPEWPDGSPKEWLQNLQRPDNHLHPQRQLDPKSLFCCGASDVVKTKFKVENGGDRYPEDVWYAWLDNAWTRIHPEKIIKDFAPDNQAYLFMVAGTIQCFVRPKGGL